MARSGTWCRSTPLLAAHGLEYLSRPEHHWGLLNAFRILLVRRTSPDDDHGRKRDGAESGRSEHRAGAGAIVWLSNVRRRMAPREPTATGRPVEHHAPKPSRSVTTVS